MNDPNTDPAPVYRVLARKYRPRTFAELIGQDALVRTLSNAFASGRIAQAFMLTGVRGVGKTTTARIIARALNCTGVDGNGGPTVSPCGVCDNCRAIAEDRHVDVIEMDAASHTGVDDIREIIDGVRYAPVSARFKLYIVDEVHMLSRQAFNALLKTLEEPPAHVKFVFATTEIRKVPITVLSRCQRFDLRRIDTAVLKDHFIRIAGQEGVAIEPDAAALIAKAADGSVRDGLSLLDQAIALGNGDVTALQVRDMLGLADRTRVIDLFEAAVSAKPAKALDILADLNRVGADPLVILQDLLDLVHTLTRLKVVPETATDPGLPEAERTQGASLAQRLGMPALTRAWQLLLKGLGEVQAAPAPQQALDMVILRMAFVADLPTPGELVRQWQSANTGNSQAAPNPPGGGGPSGAGGGFGGSPSATATARSMAGGAAPRLAAAEAPAIVTRPASEAIAATPAATDSPRDFAAVVQLFAENREGMLYGQLCESVHLVKFEPGRLTIRPEPAAPPTLANCVGQLLSTWTGQRWMVVVSDAPGEPTLAERSRAAERQAQAQAEANPLIQAVLATFEGAKIIEIRDATVAQPPDADTADLDDVGIRDALLYPQDEEGDL